jgi:hypothetical protein
MDPQIQGVRKGMRFVPKKKEGNEASYSIMQIEGLLYVP